MKFLFVFAHPDDETIACAGTIHQLSQAGHEVMLVSVTDGGAGEVMKPAEKKLQELGSVKKLRRFELEQVSQHLGLQKHQYLEYEDGQITNQEVWGKLKEDIIEVFERERPDVVVTFDHTGWYFHLDHVGVSIATTWAFKQSIHRPQALLLSQLRITGSKWEYVYPPLAPTHYVVVKDVHHKIQAMQQHASQDLETPKQFVVSEKTHKEWYQLAFAEENNNTLIEESGIFLPVEDQNFRL